MTKEQKIARWNRYKDAMAAAKEAGEKYVPPKKGRKCPYCNELIPINDYFKQEVLEEGE